MFSKASIGNPSRGWKCFSWTYLAVVGLAPLIALVIEHGWHASLFLSSHPHYFFFQPFVCPFAVYALGTPLGYLWENVITRKGKAVFILLPIIISISACTYDFFKGTPALFEFVSSVQVDPKYKVGPYNLWDFFEKAESLYPLHPGGEDLAKQYSKQLQSLASEGRRSWIVIPYYIGLFVQIAFGILLVLAIGSALAHREKFLKEKSPSSALIIACWICFAWLPLQVSFISTKRILYGDEDATSVIALLGLIILFFMLFISTFLVQETNEKIFSFTISMMATGLAVLSPIYSANTGISQLFGRRWPIAWYFIIYFFTLLFFLPSFLGITKETAYLNEVEHESKENLKRESDHK